jgi:hypothetical protein
MRPSSSNKRLRGRSRKGPNPLTRSFESNGPDVKIRGTAMHIAEKYVQLARDAQVSGDIVMAENYFQHAEHYFRMIAAAQPQVTGPGQHAFGRDDEGDDEFDGSPRQDFNNRPEPYGQQQQPSPPPRGNGAPYQSYDQGGQRSGGYEPREHRSHDNRGQDNRGYDNRGQDNRGQDSRGYDNRSQDNRGHESRGYDNRGPDNRGHDTRYQEGRSSDEGRPQGDSRPRDSRPHHDGNRSQHDSRYQPAGEPRHGDRPQVNGNHAAPLAAPAAAAAPLPGLGPQPDLEPPVAATPAVAAVPVTVPVDTASVAPVPALAEDGTPRPRRRSRGSRGRGRRPEGGPGGEEGDDGSPALPFAEDAAPSEG